MKFYFSVELWCFFLRGGDLGGVPCGDRLISFFQFFCSHVQGNGGKKRKKEKKKKKFLKRKRELYLHGGRAGIEWSIQFCQGSHSLLCHQYSAKIVTQWYLLYFEFGDFLKLESFRSLGLQCDRVKPDGKYSPETTAWKTWPVLFEQKVCSERNTTDGRRNECGIKLQHYLFDRILCTVSMTFLIFSTVILLVFW